MNVHISYKVHKTPDIEQEINHLIEKLNRRLRAFRPELVHLKGLIEENSPRQGVVVSLSLHLPSGQMAAQESAANAVGALKAASDDLVVQLGKHKAQLRSSRKWRRRGSDQSFDENPTGKFQTSREEEDAAPERPALRSDDIRSYVNAHLGRLERFVERELHFRETAGQVNPGAVTQSEVVDEVVVRALSDAEEAPQQLALEPWLYRLAILSISDLSFRASQGLSDVPPNGPTPKPDGTASDESEMEFHQPDEFIGGTDVIADSAGKTPEDIAYADEMISLVQFALGDTNGSDREIFVLHSLEGFSVTEIAAITDRKSEDVRTAINVVREKLRRSVPIRNGFKEGHLQRAGTD